MRRWAQRHQRCHPIRCFFLLPQRYVPPLNCYTCWWYFLASRQRFPVDAVITAFVRCSSLNKRSLLLGWRCSHFIQIHLTSRTRRKQNGVTRTFGRKAWWACMMFSNRVGIVFPCFSILNRSVNQRLQIELISPTNKPQMIKSSKLSIIVYFVIQIVVPNYILTIQCVHWWVWLVFVLYFTEAVILFDWR